MKFHDFRFNTEMFFRNNNIDSSLMGDELVSLGQGLGQIMRKYAVLSFEPRADERDPKAVELIKFKGIRDLRVWLSDLS